MGKMVQLSAADGHTLGAWLAKPEGTPKAGLIILQEIFGITEHLRTVAKNYASHGYLTIVPSLFDRVQPGVVLDYSAVEQGREIMMQLDLDDVVRDMIAARDAVQSAGKVAAVGYCWGGAMADLAACRAGVDAASAYYGRMIINWLDLKTACPVIYHFGETDALIPMDMVDQIKAGRPEGEFHIYPGAGHGFDCVDRDDFSPENAELALARTLKFFEETL
jgi:carboxymethylenebutenolidase